MEPLPGFLARRARTLARRRPTCSTRCPAVPSAWRNLRIGASVKFAFITPRYGAEISAGAEHACRLLAEQVSERHDVEVLTTCSRDHRTWKNEYGEGADRIRGVLVRRFARQPVRTTTCGVRRSSPQRLFRRRRTRAAKRSSGYAGSARGHRDYSST